MAIKTKAELQTYSTDHILSGGSQTKAADIRTFITDVLDSIIVGSFAATAGLIPFGTGVADTLEASDSLKFADENLTIINSTMPIRIGAWETLAGTMNAIYFAGTPNVDNVAIGGDDDKTYLNAFEEINVSIENVDVARVREDRVNIKQNLALTNDLGDVPDERLFIDGNMKLKTAGNHIIIKGGAGAYIGNAVLVGGTKTVVHAGVTNARSRILLTRKTGASPNMLTYIINDNTDFQINSGDPGDNGTITYMIFEQL